MTKAGFPCRLCDIDFSTDDYPALGALPYDHHRYFVLGPSTLVLPMTMLRASRARPQGIVNAFKLMGAASKGDVPRRLPLLVTQDATSSDWLIVDGNSTAIVAFLVGWPDLPCTPAS